MPQTPKKGDPYASLPDVPDPYASLPDVGDQPPSTPAFAGTKAAPPGLLSRISPRLAAIVGADQGMSLNPLEIFKEQSPGEYEQDVRAFGAGGAGVLKGLWQIATSDPQQFEQMLRQGYAGQEQQKDALLKEAERREAAGQGYQWRLRIMAGGHAMASVLPFVGPGVADQAEKIGRGGPEGGAAQAELLGSFTLPKVGGEVLGKSYRGGVELRELYRGLKGGETPPEAVTPGWFRERLRGLVGASGALRTEVQKAADAHAAKVATRDTAVANVEQARKQALAAPELERQKITQERERIAEENRLARQEHERGVAEKRKQAEAVPELERVKAQRENERIAEQNRLEQEKVTQAETQRNEGLQTAERQARQTGEQIQQVGNRVEAEANRRFRAVRDRLGDLVAAATRSAQPLIDAVENAKTNILQDIGAQGVTEFNAITKLSGEEEVLRQVQKEVRGNLGANAPDEEFEAAVDRRMQEEREAGNLEPEDVSWDKLQALKTRIEAKLRSRSTSPMMKRALGSVRDVVVDQMGEIAEEGGATEEWESARDFWKQWKQDFSDWENRSGSRSPLADVMEAVDPSAMRRGVMRTQEPGVGGSNRAMTILRERYADFGGNEAATSAEGMVQQWRGIPKAPRPFTPTPPKEAPPLVVPIAGTSGAGFEETPLPEFPPEVVPISEATRTPAPVEQQTVDVADVARREMERRSRYLKPTPGRTIGIVGGSAVMALVSTILGKNPFENASTAAGGVMGGLAFGWTQSIAGDLLINPEFQRFLANASEEEIQALNSIPGADRVRIKNSLTDSAVQAARRGYPVRGGLLQFVGPGNAAKIAAAAGYAAQRRPAQTPAEAKQALGQ